MSAVLLTTVAVTRRVTLTVRQGTTINLDFIAAAVGVARLGTKVVIIGAFSATYLVRHTGGDV